MQKTSKTYLPIGIYRYLFFPSILALIAGVWLGAQTPNYFEQKRLVNEMNHLAAQNYLVAENLESSIREIRKKAIEIKDLNGSEDEILHWSKFSLKKDGSLRLQKKLVGPNLQVNNLKDFEEKYISQVEKELDKEFLSKAGFSVLAVETEQDPNAEWLAIGFTDRNKSIDDLVVILVDPDKVFSVFKRFSRIRNAGKRRVYLMNESGKILIHSEKGFNGANFSSSKIFIDGISKLFQDAHFNSGAGSFDSVNEMPVMASYRKIGGLPLALVTEYSRDPKDVLSEAFILAVWNQHKIGISSVLGGLLLFLFLIGRLQTSRLKRALAIETTVESNNEPKVENFSAVPQKNHVERNVEKHIETMAGAFDDEEHELQIMSSLETKLTQVASEVCKKPVLFFSYNAKRSRAVFTSKSGEAPITETLKNLHFPLDAKIAEKITELAEKAKITSLSSYQPLQAILPEGSEIEAWALVTHFQAEEKAGSKPKLLGILVVMDVDASFSHRETLFRIMRTTGKAYERNLTLSNS